MILYTEGEMAEKLVAQAEVYRAEINKLNLLLEKTTQQGFAKGAEWMREAILKTESRYAHDIEERIFREINIILPDDEVIMTDLDKNMTPKWQNILDKMSENVRKNKELLLRLENKYGNNGA